MFTGLHPECTGHVGFSTAGRAGDKNIPILCDVLTGRQPLNKRPIQLTVVPVVNRGDGSIRLFESGIPDQPLQPVVLACSVFSIDEHSETVLKGNLRKELQKRQTPSARRRLKAIGQRENRWMQDVNHCISKALVESNPKHTLFVLEDLTGIRNVTERVKMKDRYVSVSWSFYDLEQKLIYKAKQNQSTVIKVDPRYTSQCCPVCGHIEKSNRNKKIHLFTCKNCGYKSNDDRIGAMNLYHMGISYLKEAQVPDTVTIEQALS